jgi:hypothetical protein
MMESLRLRAAAAALTLLSGVVMMSAGYIGQAESWATAGLITIPGGIVVLAAFALAHRADRVDGRALASSDRRAAPPGAMGGILLSGGVMVFAGYAGSAWGWGPAVTLASLGGLMIGTAFALARRGTESTTRSWEVPPRGSKRSSG